MPGEAARAADRVDVQDEDADDLAEAERDDREVVAAQTQRRQPDEISRDRREHGARRRAPTQEQRACAAGVGGSDASAASGSPRRRT